MPRKVLTAANGRPYVLNTKGRAEFISNKAAKAAGWTGPKKSKKKK